MIDSYSLGHCSGEKPVLTFSRHALALLLALICLLVGGKLNAQEAKPAPQIIKVGVYVSPPFVMKDNERYTGMAIELWETIAAKLNLVSEYKEFQNYTEIVKAVADGTVDAGVTNLSITEERAKIIDFTHPWYDAGLRVMIHTKAGAGGFWDVVRDLGDAGHLEAYAWIGGGLLLLTVLLTLLDRLIDKEFHERWGPGLAESFYHIVSAVTSGQASHKNLFGPLGTVIAAVWMICGVAVTAYITSSIASVMTAAHFTNQINSVADLQGRIVGVRAGSIAEAYMKSVRVRTRPFNHMAEAADALSRGEISAIVGDSPVLEYFAHANPNLSLSVVGNIFRPDKYGFAFTTGNPLTKPASIEIIGARESGEIEKLKTQYFGFEP